VSWVTSLPSLFINQTSTAPLRFDEKAIWSEPPIGVGNDVVVMVGDGLGVDVKVG
jgi:hypothetical protein